LSRASQTQEIVERQEEEEDDKISKASHGSIIEWKNIYNILSNFSIG